jgi:hypothetical protein
VAQFTDVIEIEQNVDFSDFWVPLAPDPSGLENFANLQYQNFTGYGAQLIVRQFLDRNSTALLTLGLGTGLAFVTQAVTGVSGTPTNNGYQVTVTAAQALAMTPGTYYYNLLLTTPGGLHVDQQGGQWVVAPQMV